METFFFLPLQAEKYPLKDGFLGSLKENERPARRYSELILNYTGLLLPQ